MSYIIGQFKSFILESPHPGQVQISNDIYKHCSTYSHNQMTAAEQASYTISHIKKRAGKRAACTTINNSIGYD